MELWEARLKSLKGRNLFACHAADLWPMPPRTPRIGCEDNHTRIFVRPASVLANTMDKRPLLDCLRPAHGDVSRKIQTNYGGYKPTLSMVWLSTSATHLPCRCKICWWKSHEKYGKVQPGCRARNEKKKVDREHIKIESGEVEARAIAKVVKIVMRPVDLVSSPCLQYRRSRPVDAGKGLEVDQVSLPPG